MGKEFDMTLQEALDTEIGATVDYIKSHMSVKDGERLEDLIKTLKSYAYPGRYTHPDVSK